MVLLLLWPFRLGFRTILSIIPIYMYFVLAGLSVALSGLIRNAGANADRLQKRAVCAVGCALALLFLYHSVKIVRVAQAARDSVLEGPLDPQSQEMFSAVRRMTEPDAVMVFHQPRAMTLFTSRRSIAIWVPSQLTRGQYWVVHKRPRSRTWVEMAVSGGKVMPDGPCVESVFENDSFQIFRIGASRS
jgi:hypothetical protein